MVRASRFGTLSTQIAGLTLVTASGEVLECSAEREPEIFKAAQVSLGTLGVIAAVTLRVVPAKRLRLHRPPREAGDCLANLERYKPRTTTSSSTGSPIPGGRRPSYSTRPMRGRRARTSGATFNKIVLENGAFWRALPPGARGATALPGHQSDLSLRAFRRWTRWTTATASMPRRVWCDSRRWSTTSRPSTRNRCWQRSTSASTGASSPSTFPVEVPLRARGRHLAQPRLPARVGATSPSTCTRQCPIKDYFAAVEEIFTRYDGRPALGQAAHARRGVSGGATIHAGVTSAACALRSTRRASSSTTTCARSLPWARLSQKDSSLDRYLTTHRRRRTTRGNRVLRRPLGNCVAACWGCRMPSSSRSR